VVTLALLVIVVPAPAGCRNEPGLAFGKVGRTDDVGVRCLLALLATAGLGVAGCGGGTSHAHASAPRAAAQAARSCTGPYATSFFLTYLDGLRGAGRLLDPSTPRPARVLLQTVRMP